MTALLAAAAFPRRRFGVRPSARGRLGSDVGASGDGPTHPWSSR